MLLLLLLYFFYLSGIEILRSLFDKLTASRDAVANGRQRAKSLYTPETLPSPVITHQLMPLKRIAMICEEPDAPMGYVPSYLTLLKGQSRLGLGLVIAGHPGFRLPKVRHLRGTNVGPGLSGEIR